MLEAIGHVLAYPAKGEGRTYTWSSPGEGARESHPSRPARGDGGALCELPHRGPGAEPQMRTLFALENPPNIITDMLAAPTMNLQMHVVLNSTF